MVKISSDTYLESCQASMTESPLWEKYSNLEFFLSRIRESTDQKEIPYLDTFNLSSWKKITIIEIISKSRQGKTYNECEAGKNGS